MPAKKTSTIAAVERLLTPRDAAALLGVSPRTLERWRCDGRRLPFVRMSKNVARYRRSDVEAFVAERYVEVG